MSRRIAAIAELQEKLGHTFADQDLLERALTHISAVHSGKPRTESYQRLEFLGDRVLGLVVAEMLVAAFPGAEEGELSRRLAELVRTESCAEVGVEMGVAPAIRLDSGEAHNGGRRKQALLADVCEAVIGALYLDAGFETARGVVRRFWHERMMNPRRPLQDAKTALQEWAQGRGLPTPTYREIERSGPDHRPMFNIEVLVAGLPVSTAQGRSKRDAEQAAARAFLVREGAWEAGNEKND